MAQPGRLATRRAAEVERFSFMERGERYLQEKRLDWVAGLALLLRL